VVPLPPPIYTPVPGGPIIIDHRYTDASYLSQQELNEARTQVIFFSHKSIGNNILAGITDLRGQDYTRHERQTAVQGGRLRGQRQGQARRCVYEVLHG
jgi:hypothetical protein